MPSSFRSRPAQDSRRNSGAAAVCRGRRRQGDSRSWRRARQAPARGSTSGTASASRNAIVAPAVQAAAMPRKGKRGRYWAERQRGRDGKRRQRERADPGADAAEFDQRIAAEQIVHRRGVDVHAGDRVAGECLARRRRRQRAALRARAFGRGGKALGGDLAVLDVEHRAEQHDLAVEMAAGRSPCRPSRRKRADRRAKRSECRRRRPRSSA